MVRTSGKVAAAFEQAEAERARRDLDDLIVSAVAALALLAGEMDETHRQKVVAKLARALGRFVEP